MQRLYSALLNSGLSFSTPLFQYFCASSAVGTFNGRTMRKPRNCASVWYQMLFGSCGSWIFHVASEARRMAQRSLAGSSSSQEPPRATCGYGLLALFHGLEA